MINIAWPNLLKHRSDFRFSFQEVRITVSDDGNVIVHDKDGITEICRTVAVTQSAKGTFPGSIEAIRLRNLRDTVICILSHDGLVAVLDCNTGEWNSPSICAHLDDMPSAISIEGAMNAFDHWQQLIMSRREVRKTVKAYEKQAIKGVDFLYPQLICQGWQPGKRRRMMNPIKERGIAALFDTELQKERVAQLSLLVGTGSRVDAIARELEMSTEDLRSQIVEINNISSQKCGFEPFILSEDEVRSRI